LGAFFSKSGANVLGIPNAAFSAVLAVRQKAKDFADRKSGQKTAKNT
jgi:hypothetical protein